MENFEEQLRKDLHQFLLSMKVVSEREQSDACINSAEREQARPEVKWVDERMPECPDVEEKWEEIAKAYIPDGIREEVLLLQGVDYTVLEKVIGECASRVTSLVTMMEVRSLSRHAKMANFQDSQR